MGTLNDISNGFTLLWSANCNINLICCKLVNCKLNNVSMFIKLTLDPPSTWTPCTTILSIWMSIVGAPRSRYVETSLTAYFILFLINVDWKSDQRWSATPNSCLIKISALNFPKSIKKWYCWVPYIIPINFSFYDLRPSSGPLNIPMVRSNNSQVRSGISNFYWNLHSVVGKTHFL